MQLTVVSFWTGFVLGFILFFSFLAPKFDSKSEVLAEVSFATVLPKETSILEPTASPTPKPTKRATPTPVPTPTPIPTPAIPTPTPDVWSPPELEPLFAQYAGTYNVDKNLLERIANCESHFNPNAQNGRYVGLFQFDASTWQVNRGLMGLDPNLALRTNAEESIKTAAFLASRRGSAPWPSCVELTFP